MVQEEPQVFNVHRAALFLGVHSSTIRRWASAGKLQGTKIGARGDWRFTREALLKTRRSENVPDEIARPASSLASPASFLIGGGEMEERMRSFDWSKTPVGPVEQWPQSLRTGVSIMLNSAFPMFIWWGKEEATNFYNDAYIPALTKAKHPQWLGRSAKACWKEIWHIVGPLFEHVMDTGKSTYSEDLQLLVDRNIPQEEAYFTFSYSALRTDTGEVGGVFCACSETTARVIGERRLRLLRDLGAQVTSAKSVEEACSASAHILSSDPYDIPFSLIYLLDSDGKEAHLTATSQVQAGTRAAPQTIKPGEKEEKCWPLAYVQETREIVQVDCLLDAFGPLPGGAWPESPRSAFVIPLAVSGQKQLAGFLILGISPRRILDEEYRSFFHLVANHVTTAIANARAFEEERKRVEALAEIDRAKTLFFSNVSHEFRTPLTLMLGPVEDVLAEKQRLSPQQRERVEILHHNALRLLKLVNTLLDFSRIEAGRVEAVYEPTNLAALTADLASSFRSVMERAGLRLIVNCPPLDEPVYVDHEMWEKIILNLLSNAFKYTFEGEISVTLQRHDSSVEVSVKDTGVGIPAEELPHMFERFHRVRGTTGRTIEGTGIGLSLVHELVKLQGGTISVTSSQGHGSTFTISLPLGKAHLPQDRIAAQHTLASTAINTQFYVHEALRLLVGAEDDVDVDMLSDVPLPSNGRRAAEKGKQSAYEEQVRRARILFADDNADMRDYVSRLLKQHYTVKAVSDGQAALAAMKDFQPDLVLTDVMMPAMDGFELLQALRADQETRTLPVILLSARAGEEAKVEGMQAGADDYLTKPFSTRELLARIGAHLEMARIRREAEERIQVERQKLYDLFMQAPAMIAILRGPEHMYELANPLYMQGIGLHRSIIGKPIREAIPELEGQNLYELLDTVYQTGQPAFGTEVPVYLARKSDGALEETYFNFVYQPSYNADGEIDGILVHAVDVTAQVKARQRTEELSQQKDEFLGVASHELKTPVTSVKAYSQLLERRFQQAGDEKAAELLRKMGMQLNKLTTLIGDLLEVTKIESGKLLLRPTTFDYHELIREIVEEIQRTTSKHAIIQDLSAPVQITADRDRIGQVLINLLTNAIKYSPLAETVVVQTVQRDGMIVTSVRDFGIGIPKEKQQHLFERFYRVEGEMQVTYPGLGLGLYISAEFVKRHQGSIWVESIEGEGSTFSFSLPLSLSSTSQVPEKIECGGKTA